MHQRHVSLHQPGVCGVACPVAELDELKLLAAKFRQACRGQWTQYHPLHGRVSKHAMSGTMRSNSEVTLVSFSTTTPDAPPDQEGLYDRRLLRLMVPCGMPVGVPNANMSRSPISWALDQHRNRSAPMSIWRLMHASWTPSPANLDTICHLILPSGEHGVAAEVVRRQQAAHHPDGGLEHRRVVVAAGQATAIQAATLAS